MFYTVSVSEGSIGPDLGKKYDPNNKVENAKEENLISLLFIYCLANP